LLWRTYRNTHRSDGKSGQLHDRGYGRDLLIDIQGQVFFQRIFWLPFRDYRGVSAQTHRAAKHQSGPPAVRRKGKGGGAQAAS